MDPTDVQEVQTWLAVTAAREKNKILRKYLVRQRENGTCFSFDDFYFNYSSRFMGEEEIKEAFSGSCSKAQGVGSSHVD